MYSINWYTLYQDPATLFTSSTSTSTSGPYIEVLRHPVDGQATYHYLTFTLTHQCGTQDLKITYKHFHSKVCPIIELKWQTIFISINQYFYISMCAVGTCVNKSQVTVFLLYMRPECILTGSVQKFVIIDHSHSLWRSNTTCLHQYRMYFRMYMLSIYLC